MAESDCRLFHQNSDLLLRRYALIFGFVFGQVLMDSSQQV